ncbi:MAG: flagellar hook protein FlgE [Sulfurovum sp. FS06-10]|nr:MAG: flagellar hook protein FlgE [Sulfurovum sp. FS06-10]
MMRSLWAGVSGLQAHQIAMDIEGNNIANVNTAGFKYSRANFADLLSQTSKIATAPQGELGGKNPMQIGLGTQVSSVTKIFKQGSVQTTDKNTDLAIQGGGFFVVSPDGGSTYKYTRNGDFNFDAKGNFTDANGYIIQGWIRDEATGEIDSSTPIANITIPPGLTTPARQSSYINLKANLNSGNTIDTKSPIYSLDSRSGWIDANGNGIQDVGELHDEDRDDPIFDIKNNQEIYEKGEDMGILFDADGKAIGLEEGEGVWVSYADAKIETYASATAIGNITFSLNGKTIATNLTGSTSADNASLIARAINDKSNETGIIATSSTDGKVTILNKNDNGTASNMKNIDFEVISGNPTGLFTDNTLAIGLTDREVITAFHYTYNESTSNYIGVTRTDPRQFNTTEDLRDAMQRDARMNTDYLGNGNDTAAEVLLNMNDGVKVMINNEGQFQISNPGRDAFNEDDGDIYNANIPTTITVATALTRPLEYPRTSTIEGGFTLAAAQTVIIPVGTVVPAALAATYPLAVNASNEITQAGGLSVTNADNADLSSGNFVLPATATITLPIGATINPGAATIDLPVGADYVDADGDDFDMNLAVTAFTDATHTENRVFTSIIGTLQGALPTDSTGKFSQSMYAASHASSIDIYDSLGSKHTVRLEFRKAGVTADGGMEWDMKISVEKPAVIDASRTDENKNILTGVVKFASDGSLDYFSPSTINFTGNNGSTANQSVRLNLGSIGQFDGVTSFDSPSNTSGISQDGYTGGDLAGIRVDETGTLIGSFTNGRSFGLAKVAMASFSNDGGLESDGGNTFIQTSNSGEPIIGQASVGGRGFIQASALEMSNADLSRSLTQLIIIQRGYQANSKTITTSDQMLNTLLQLKQ